MKRLYIDVSALCRPFDDQSARRVRLENDAVYLILKNVQSGRYSMVVSPVHRAEINAIDEVGMKFDLLALLERCGIVAQFILQDARSRTIELRSRRFGIADAAHIAVAEMAADVFITCDDRLLRKCRRHGVKIPAMNPAEFCSTENLR